ncbi:hypothetical protein [Flavonifractor hominis]|uniref:Uncharacterized protein n=1 Tax=Flavonifractor hominis TaxID=3133178 RepID=A0ABV1EMD5_9FIRM
MYYPLAVPTGCYGYQGTLMVPPQFAEQIMGLTNALFRATAANAQLQQQLAQKNTAEEAFSDTAVFDDFCTYTSGKHNNALLLMNTYVCSALHVVPKPPYAMPPFYSLHLFRISEPLILDEEHYFADSALVNAFQESPSVSVKLRRSTKNTASLLRSAISRVVQHISLDYYAGWQGDLRFTFFPGFVTHRSNQGQEIDASITNSISAASAATAVEKFCPLFEVVRDEPLRWHLFLWFHAAALYSLLEQLSFPLPMGLSIFTTDGGCATYLKSLLNWYGDPTVSLSVAPDLFTDHILSRKDQPLFILDEYRTSDAMANAGAFAKVLVTGQIPWKHKRETKYLPLLALPVVLSGQSSSLSCSPELMLLELTQEQLDRKLWIDRTALLQYRQDYLSAFTSYTQKHIDCLKSALQAWSLEALKLSGEALSEPCLHLWGIMAALDEFVYGFYDAYDAISASSIWTSPQEERMDHLLDLLSRASLRGQDSSSDLRDFVDVVRSHIRSGILAVCPTTHVSRPADDTLVYFDNEYLYFPTPAFRLICQTLSQSRPDLLRALADAGMLCGSPINAETRMTRVSVWNVYGVRDTVSVYKVKRSVFETFGDPLFLKDEVDL